MRTSLRIASSLAAVALLAASPAAAAAAARKITIKATALTPYVAQQYDYRFTVVTGGPQTAFWAALKLPVGARITGLSYRRFALAATETDVGIYRVQPGKVPAKERIYSGAGGDISPDIATGTIVNGAFSGPTRKVQAGWDYYVLARNAGPNTWIGDIVIRYETP